MHYSYHGFARASRCDDRRLLVGRTSVPPADLHPVCSPLRCLCISAEAQPRPQMAASPTSPLGLQHGGGGAQCAVICAMHHRRVAIVAPTRRIATRQQWPGGAPHLTPPPRSDIGHTAGSARLQCWPSRKEQTTAAPRSVRRTWWAPLPPALRASRRGAALGCTSLAGYSLRPSRACPASVARASHRLRRARLGAVLRRRPGAG